MTVTTAGASSIRFSVFVAEETTVRSSSRMEKMLSLDSDSAVAGWSATATCGSKKQAMTRKRAALSLGRAWLTPGSRWLGLVSKTLSQTLDGADHLAHGAAGAL